MLNRRKQQRGQFSSKFRGVAHRGGKARGNVKNDRGYSYELGRPWTAYFGRQYLGIAATEEEAAMLYDLAALRNRGPAAQLNFPIEGLRSDMR